MSAESGIPTFRDAQTGMWAKFRAEDLATPEAFEANPARVWQWYEERRETVRAARPHAGHQALVVLESMVPGGNILRSKCHITGRSISSDWLAGSQQAAPQSPYVSHGFARPDVVWFGEMLPREALQEAMDAAVRCDFCISAGTTSLVQPAASLPLMAKEHGAALVEINPEETPLSPHADQCIRGTAAEVLTTLVSQLKSWKTKNRNGE